MKTLVFMSFLFCAMGVAQVGIGTVSPDDDLDVVGNTQVSGYLRIGNPAVPQTVNNTGMLLYSMGGADYYSGFVQNGCNTTIWSGTQTGTTATDTGIMQYDNIGARNNQNLVSPHIWVPSNANNITVEVSHFCTLENNFDGVYLQYSTNDGGTWNDIPAGNFFLGGYTGTVAGTSSGCGGNDNALAWTGTQNNMVTAFFLTLTNTWVQFRFVASEDASVGTGEYNLMNFTVFSNSFSSGHGGAFAGGNIYAENNIYAGSNVLLGDLAEFFPTVGKVEKGDIISFVNGNRDMFSVSTKEHDPNVIGIYSSNPTLTLNDPNSGIPVALQGRVPINVVGEAINKGDYLTASNIPGKAKKATESSFVVGRALEDFKGGKGQIICLVETGWKTIVSPNNTNQISSNGVFKTKSKVVKVTNPMIQENSQVFITFRGDIGSRHWIENITDGAFEIHLEKTSKQDVNFDYLVQNAQNSNSNSFEHIYQKPLNTITKQKPLKKGSNSSRQAPVTSSIIPTEQSNSSPPIPEDTTKAYTWSKGKGLESIQ